MVGYTPFYAKDPDPSHVFVVKWMAHENEFVQVAKHPWFDGFNWQGLPLRDAPILPPEAKELPEMLEYLKTCPKSDPTLKQLIQKVTQNFDTFEDYCTYLDMDLGWA